MKPKSIVGLSEKFAAKFWKLVHIAGPDECWPWQGAVKYGCGVVKTKDGARQAHRVAYTLRVGEIPEGLTLDHVKKRGCVSKLCCNDAHLEPVTQSENISRYNELRPRGPYCKYGHLREREQRCSTCARLAAEKTKAKNPVEHFRRARHYQALRTAKKNATRLYALTCSKGHAKEFGASHCRKCSRLAVKASTAKYGYDWGAYKRARWEKLRTEDPAGYAAKRREFNRDKRAKEKARRLKTR